MSHHHDVKELGTGWAHHQQGAAAVHTAVDAGRTQMHEPASDTAGVKATVFTRVCLEQLRKELQAFATDRNRDQYHTPRNLLLALIAEVSVCTFSVQTLAILLNLQTAPPQCTIQAATWDGAVCMQAASSFKVTATGMLRTVNSR